ncbi:MAG: tryptophan-rich sensory protein [Candidatus Gracilibacteria bacterium]|nr:tryptophan-rich sensory protein [Candidatus Gracilibacteria bacterium]
MNKYTKILISIGLPLLIGLISSYFTLNSIESWYMTLNKPFFNPPNWIFGPVWTFLYILIGISFYLVWNKGFGKNENNLKTIYFLQLFLNFLWSISFFYLENPLLGLINIIALWIVILYNIVLFYKVDKKSGFLLIPYLLWVSFASILNLYIYLLN